MVQQIRSLTKGERKSGSLRSRFGINADNTEELCFAACIRHPLPRAGVRQRHVARHHHRNAVRAHHSPAAI
jgi:hypothetical protein